MQVFLWWFLYWKHIILLLGFLFIVVLYFYIKFFQIGDTFFWKIKYILLTLTLLFLIFYTNSENLLGFLINELQKKQLTPETVQLRDPQEYIFLSFEISLFYSILYAVPLILSYTGFYILTFWKKYKQNISYIYFSLLLYYFLLIKWIVDNDLYLSGWEFTLDDTHIDYQFQPDLALLNWFYLGEFWDLLTFFLTYLSLLLLSVYKINWIWGEDKRNLWFKLQIIIYFVILSYSYYLFGGESLFRDFILSFIIIFCLELYYFIILFLSFLKFKK